MPRNSAVGQLLSDGVFVCAQRKFEVRGDVLDKAVDAMGLLEERAQQARQVLTSCTLCPRRCGVNRLAGEMGFCRVGQRAMISSVGPHFGEEAPLVGRCGSGTIFFSGCNLGCLFCQNYDISHLMNGREILEEELADQMLYLQSLGCHNINLVTPTHVVPQILGALALASRQGLHLPIVYNCGGYESLETLKLLDGVIQIYMPDFKYGDNAVAERYSGAEDYFDRASEALREMHRQVGDLALDERGIARKGLLIRHLVLPGGLAGTERIMEFIAQELSPNSYVNVMAQYHPQYRAREFPELDRRITKEEYWQAIDMAKRYGIMRLDRE